MKAAIQIALFVVLLASITRAQSPEQSWDNLQTLRNGERIQVVDQKLKSQRGPFVSFSEEAISLRVKQDDVTIQRSDVFRVSSQERGRTRGRNALLGFAVGAGVGLAIGSAMYTSGSLDVSTAEAATAAFVSAPLSIGLVGAGIGAALPPGHPTIYRAGRRETRTKP